MNFRIIAKTLGVLACLAGLAMAACWLYAEVLCRTGPGPATDLETSAARAFGVATGITVAFGIVLVLLGIGVPHEVLRREAIVIVGLSWIQVGLLGALPFYLCEPGLRLSESIFESVSGFTTTGSTVMSDIESFPKALLLWRSVTQWLGGIGILVVFVAVLSFLGVGSRSLVQQESSINISDAGAARIREVAFALLKVYLSLSVVCYLGLLALGMPSFEAVCHAMTTIATGGFSPKNASIGHYENLWIELWIVIFMFAASIGFMLYIFLLNRNWSRLRSEEEARYYLLLIVAAILAIALDLRYDTDDHTYAQALRGTFFNAVSIGSTTGFAVADYDRWPLFSRMLLMVMMLIGGCAGSTAGGIKMNRIILFGKIASSELVRSFRPHRVVRIRLNGAAPDERVFMTVSLFIAMGFAIAAASAILLTLLEPQLDIISALGCVFATLFNIGPGFEAVGPTDNFGFLGADTQLLLAFLMVLGRLEFFAVLVLFVPSLWKAY
ncbi:MAG: TrkH family potassium uptake protein [Verrucomicrobiales bacterium]